MPLARRTVAALALLKLAIHLALLGRYGYFRDELYFLDCGRHLAWGYVDHAPMVGLLARVPLAFGGSLLVMRLLPALAGAALVYLTGLLAARFGGGPFAQAVAALAVVVAPIYLGTDSLFTMNAFEPLFWMGALALVLRLRETGERRLWLVVGLLLGLGLMNKHSTAFFGLALGLGLLLSPQRQELRTRWPWLGVLLALAVFAPNLAWQAAHGFPTLEDLRNVAASGKNVVLGPLDFFLQQVLLVHPLQAPLWLGGVAATLVAWNGRFRFVGLSYLVFYALLFLLHAKNYYLAPIYPVLLAAGAAALEPRLSARPARAAVLGLMAAAGALTAPLVLPLLSPEGLVAYQKRLHLEQPRTERAHAGPLPQIFGDQFGWPELVQEVARIYHALPPEDRAKAAIFTGNYGEAGAINQFGPALGLPRAISGHQTYFFWGPQGASGEVLIVLQDEREGLEPLFGSVVEAGRHFHPWGMAEENGPIFVVKEPKVPLAQLWPRVKHWN